MQRVFFLDSVYITESNYGWELFFFFSFNNLNLSSEVRHSRKTNTALFSSSAAARVQLAPSPLAFSLDNNPCEHLNMAVSVPPSVSFVSRAPSFLSDASKCFPFHLVISAQISPHRIRAALNGTKCLAMRHIVFLFEGRKSFCFFF